PRVDGKVYVKTHMYQLSKAKRYIPIHISSRDWSITCSTSPSLTAPCRAIATPGASSGIFLLTREKFSNIIVKAKQ
ncbi:hypothetical protein HAX54_017159, partial [Datura stramonium]|nr:hypothetical protein [Datura stramonium]